MAKVKKKRISVNAFEKAMKETYTPVHVFDWNGIEVTVNKSLTFKETLEFVDSVVKSCFTKDTNTYMPEVKDFAIKVCVLEKYANFTMPRSVEAQYSLIYYTDIVDILVLNYINQRQFDEITYAIDEKISHLAQANIEAVNKQMTSLYNAFDALQNQLSNLYSGVEETDIKNIAGAMADKALDEEKLVKAYINTVNKEDKK